MSSVSLWLNSFARLQAILFPARVSVAQSPGILPDGRLTIRLRAFVDPLRIYAESAAMLSEQNLLIQFSKLSDPAASTPVAVRDAAALQIVG